MRYINNNNIITNNIFKNHRWLDIKPDNRDILTYRVNQEYSGYTRRIAFSIYGDHNLHWILPIFNYKWYNDLNAAHNLNWPPSGSTIYYPSISIINVIM